MGLTQHYSADMLAKLMGMVLTGAGRTLVVKLFYQLGYNDPFFMVVVYLFANACALPYFFFTEWMEREQIMERLRKRFGYMVRGTETDPHDRLDKSADKLSFLEEGNELEISSSSSSNSQTSSLPSLRKMTPQSQPMQDKSSSHNSAPMEPKVSSQNSVSSHGLNAPSVHSGISTAASSKGLGLPSAHSAYSIPAFIVESGDDDDDSEDSDLPFIVKKESAPQRRGSKRKLGGQHYKTMSTSERFNSEIEDLERDAEEKKHEFNSSKSELDSAIQAGAPPESTSDMYLAMSESERRLAEAESLKQKIEGAPKGRSNSDADDLEADPSMSMSEKLRAEVQFLKQENASKRNGMDNDESELDRSMSMSEKFRAEVEHLRQEAQKNNKADQKDEYTTQNQQATENRAGKFTATQWMMNSYADQHSSDAPDLEVGSPPTVHRSPDMEVPTSAIAPKNLFKENEPEYRSSSPERLERFRDEDEDESVDSFQSASSHRSCLNNSTRFVDYDPFLDEGILPSIYHTREISTDPQYFTSSILTAYASSLIPIIATPVRKLVSFLPFGNTDLESELIESIRKASSNNRHNPPRNVPPHRQRDPPVHTPATAKGSRGKRKRDPPADPPVTPHRLRNGDKPANIISFETDTPETEAMSLSDDSNSGQATRQSKAKGPPPTKIQPAPEPVDEFQQFPKNSASQIPQKLYDTNSGTAKSASQNNMPQTCVGASNLGSQNPQRYVNIDGFASNSGSQNPQRYIDIDGFASNSGSQKNPQRYIDLDVSSSKPASQNPQRYVDTEGSSSKAASQNPTQRYIDLDGSANSHSVKSVSFEERRGLPIDRFTIKEQYVHVGLVNKIDGTEAKIEDLRGSENEDVERAIMRFGERHEKAQAQANATGPEEDDSSEIEHYIKRLGVQENDKDGQKNEQSFSSFHSEGSEVEAKMADISMMFSQRESATRPAKPSQSARDRRSTKRRQNRGSLIVGPGEKPAKSKVLPTKISDRNEASFSSFPSEGSELDNKMADVSMMFTQSRESATRIPNNAPDAQNSKSRRRQNRGSLIVGPPSADATSKKAEVPPSSNPPPAKRRKRNRGSTIGLTAESKESTKWIHRIPWWLLPLGSAVFSMMDAAFRMLSVLYLAASIAEIFTSGTEIVMGVLAARFIRKRLIPKSRWVGTFITTIGLTLVACSDFISGTKQPAESKNLGLGLLFCLCKAVGNVSNGMSHELITQVVDLESNLLLGLEGCYGICMALPLYLIFGPMLGYDPPAAFSKIADSIAAVFGVIGLVIMLFLSSSLSTAVIAATSAMTRNMWKNLRGLVVWMIGIVIFYASENESLGEPWDIPNSFVVLLGFATMMGGLYIYYKDTEVKKEDGGDNKATWLVYVKTLFAGNKSRKNAGDGVWIKADEWNRIQELIKGETTKLVQPLSDEECPSRVASNNQAASNNIV